MAKRPPPRLIEIGEPYFDERANAHCVLTYWQYCGGTLKAQFYTSGRLRKIQHHRAHCFAEIKKAIGAKLVVLRLKGDDDWSTWNLFRPVWERL